MALLFALDDSFVAPYEEKEAPFGFGELGKVTFARTYARHDNPRRPVVGTDGFGNTIHESERWVDVCRRVIEGTFTLMLEYVRDNNIEGWDKEKVSKEARSAFDLMFNLKWTPPGRGLWMMGTDFVHQRGVVEALQNCGFASTQFLAAEGGSVFAWMLEMLMVGVGIGADTRGSGTVEVKQPQGRDFYYKVPDSREGWGEALRLLIDSYLDGSNPVKYDLSEIRERGTPIRGFGGYAEGPDAIGTMLYDVRRVLERNAGSRIKTETIADIVNLIGKTVVAGNVRRSAEILIGEPEDQEFLDLKEYDKFPERNTYPEGWGMYSNNTILARRGMDYSEAAERTYKKGEPGYLWLENVHRFARMDDIFDLSDGEAMGGNPCLEQLLAHYELCTLVEIHLPRIENKEEFNRTLKAAYLYGKIVTLANDRIRHTKTREVMNRNRRIGLSLSGIAQFDFSQGSETLRDWMDHGYFQTGYWDRKWSQWLGVPESVRRTSVKPSGTVSLLSGITPGVHYPIGRYYIRNQRLSISSPLIARLIDAGYRVEPEAADPSGTVVASFPIDLGVDMPGEDDVSPWDHMALAAMVNRHWSSNATSITVKFDPEVYRPEDLKTMLEWAESRFKSISFLRDEPGVYEQMPYIRITKEDYEREIEGLRPIDLDGIMHESQDEFCDSEACEITPIEVS